MASEKGYVPWNIFIWAASIVVAITAYWIVRVEALASSVHSDISSIKIDAAVTRSDVAWIKEAIGQVKITQNVQ